jgi:hypothetical protein
MATMTIKETRSRTRQLELRCIVNPNYLNPDYRIFAQEFELRPKDGDQANSELIWEESAR